MPTLASVTPIVSRACLDEPLPMGYCQTMRILVSGGVKSGKSSRALELASSFRPDKWFLATATPFDDEMRDRIKRHKAERASAFNTIEEPIAIDTVVRNRMIVDCIPMWLNNLFFLERESEWEDILNRFIERWPEDIIIVTNETGMGVIPADPLSRRYGIVLGLANALLARKADSVELMVSGIPLRIK